MLQFEEFCRSTGLDRFTAENLMRNELLDISLWMDEELTHPFGIFHDALPSWQSLAALGLPVRDDYDPDALRFTPYDGTEDDEADDPAQDSGPTWTMSW